MGLVSNIPPGLRLLAVPRSSRTARKLWEDSLRTSPQGYASSQFNLVFESNRTSRKLWDSLNFSVVGRLPKVACIDGLREDAYIYHRDLDAVRWEDTCFAVKFSTASGATAEVAPGETEDATENAHAALERGKKFAVIRTC